MFSNLAIERGPHIVWNLELKKMLSSFFALESVFGPISIYIPGGLEHEFYDFP